MTHIKQNSILISLTKRFWHDDRGTNAIEFALVFPFLIALLLFGSAANDSVNASTEIGKVTVAVADILSQSKVIDKQVIETTLNAANFMVNARRRGNLEIMVTGVKIKADGSTEVLWSHGRHIVSLQLPSRGGSYTLPPEALTREGFLVSARARLTHTNAMAGTTGGRQESLLGTSLIGAILPGIGASTYDYESNFVPRVSIETTCSDCNI